MSEAPKLEVVGDDPREEEQREPEQPETDAADQLAEIVLFWIERVKVASNVAASIADDFENTELMGYEPNAGEVLQAMSLYELPGRLVGSYFATQQNLVQKMQNGLVQAKGGAIPPLQKGPRRPKRR